VIFLDVASYVTVAATGLVSLCLTRVTVAVFNELGPIVAAKVAVTAVVAETPVALWLGLCRRVPGSKTTHSSSPRRNGSGP
jgi:hypothetical protein